MKNLRSLFLLLLAPLMLPLQLGGAALRVHVGRAKAARDRGDRGALSIEMALIVVVIVVVAGAILAAVTSLGSKAKSAVPTNLPASPNP